ncbi:helix-turn-helix domain-containing protein [Actinomadura litoris]|uniref:helix-turn-helix domain-containing protein n=1 Tax=Actinomadura litoris TaxID=2678616 RepID=UPI001FA6D864|nr:helix-turn-helix transcriptional regulator [Actinomadura litoris]
MRDTGWETALRRDRYRDYCARVQLTSEEAQARAIGVSASYLNRLLAGERYPNRFFIAGALVVLGCAFEELFEVHARPARRRAGRHQGKKVVA